MLKRLARSFVPRSVWTRLQGWRTRRLLATYPRRIVRHRYGDVELAVELADPLGEGWYDHDWVVPPELTLLRGHGLRPGARVFDLGAHQGVVALMLAEAVGPGGQVVAVEPNPHNAAQCARNRELNAKPWVEVVQAAVTAEEGTLRLNEGLNAQAASIGTYGRVIEVAGVTIDALAARFGSPDVLFIDVEGYEVQALRGASRTLAERPDCFVEVHAGCGLEGAGGRVDDILTCFPTTTYELWAYSEGDASVQPFPQFPPGRLRKRFFLVALPRAVAEFRSRG
jgi:FkbM family methyltransferase